MKSLFGRPLVLLLPLSFLLAATILACGPRKEDPGLNRAGAYCEALGYKTAYGLVDGKSARVCVFSEKKQCEQWSFYKGHCGRRYSKCEQGGFIVRPRIEELPKEKIEYAVCLFDDGSECVEQHFAEGRCKRTQCKKWRFAQGGCVGMPDSF